MACRNDNLLWAWLFIAAAADSQTNNCNCPAPRSSYAEWDEPATARTPAAKLPAANARDRAALFGTALAVIVGGVALLVVVSLFLPAAANAPAPATAVPAVVAVPAPVVIPDPEPAPTPAPFDPV